MTPADEWAELEAVAKAATPGPWEWAYEGSGDYAIWANGVEIVSVMQPEGGSGFLGGGPADENEGNAAFIAAANPATILHLIEAARQSDGVWQPIETAPRDGTVILAWCVHPHARHATDDKDWCAPVVTQWINHNGGGWTWNGMAGTFTHWHELPLPPASHLRKADNYVS